MSARSLIDIWRKYVSDLRILFISLLKINTPNTIHYAIIRNIIVVISVFDTRRSPETISVFVKDFLEHYK